MFNLETHVITNANNDNVCSVELHAEEFQRPCKECNLVLTQLMERYSLTTIVKIIVGYIHTNAGMVNSKGDTITIGIPRCRCIITLKCTGVNFDEESWKLLCNVLYREVVYVFDYYLTGSAKGTQQYKKLHDTYAKILANHKLVEIDLDFDECMDFYEKYRAQKE